ncbi:unnamed protein product [Orchesella dallaii]
MNNHNQTGERIHRHTVCTNCKVNIPICSKCGKSGESKGNSAATSTLFDCVYKEKGCTDRLKREEVFKHVKSCRYRNESTQLCKLLGFENCKYVHKLDADRSQIIQHFVDEHDAEIGHGHAQTGTGLNINHDGFIRACASSENSIWRPVLYSLEEEDEAHRIKDVALFLFTGKVDVDTDCATWTCIKLWGKPEEKKKKIIQEGDDEEDSAFYDAEFVLECECVSCWKAAWEFEHPSQQLPSVKWTLPVADAGEEKRHLETSPVLIPLRFVRKLFVINREVAMFLSIKSKKASNEINLRKDNKMDWNRVQTVSLPLRTDTKVESKIIEKKKMVLANHIVCDGCEKYPIIGPQFKCLQCPDFDLCEECMEKEIHSFHVFVVLANKTQNQIIRQRRSRSVSQLR